jgi:predicted RNA binding protein YcfA (HicA-like mRNA interferase family)
MGELPQISGRQLIKVLKTIGYEVVRQKGSHIRLHHPFDSGKKPLTIPDHKTIGKGLMHKILRDAQIDPDTFREMLK